MNCERHIFELVFLSLQIFQASIGIRNTLAIRYNTKQTNTVKSCVSDLSCMRGRKHEN